MNLNAANHCTAISFSVKIEEDDTGTMMVHISMLYEKDGERPKLGSVKVKFEPEFDEESTESAVDSIKAAFFVCLASPLMFTCIVICKS